MSDAPPFDPSKPFTREAPAFDPAKPYTRGTALRIAPESDTSALGAFWDAIGHGAGNIAYGAARIGSRLTPEGAAGPDPSLAPAVDRMTQQRQQAFEATGIPRAHPTATAFGEYVGEAGATAPLNLVPGMAEVKPAMRAIWDAFAGAAGGALGAASSAPSENFERSVVTGAGMGAPVGAAFGAAGRVARPPALERPMMGQRPAPTQQEMLAPQQPMLALPPPTVQVPGAPWTQAGVSPGQFQQIGIPMLGTGDPRLGPALERLPQPGMIPPTPGSTMRPTPQPLPPPSPPPQQLPQLPPTVQATLPPARGAQMPQTWQDSARMLARAGVRLTPEQASGLGERARAMQEWPILRGFVQRGVANSVDDWQRITAQQALEPLGAVVPRSLKTGHDLLDFGAEQFNKAYGQFLPKVSLRRDGVARMIESDPETSMFMSEMSADNARVLSNMIENRILAPRLYEKNGMMSGETFKRQESFLTGRADSFAQSNPELAMGIRQVLSTLRDELGRQNPEYAPQIQKINQAFSMWANVRDAGIRDADSRGRFTPHDLLEILRSGDASATSFGRGRRPMQAFAEAGNEILGPSISSRIPETRSPTRIFVTDPIAGAAMTLPYLAATGLQQVPGIGRGIGALGPGAAADVGRREERGTYGGRILERVSPGAR